MKQVQDVLDRFFQGKPPRKHKIMVLTEAFDERTFSLYHYHHLILVYDYVADLVLYEWWEKPTDKRILEAAKEYLHDRKKRKEV
jgi:hypothetical protein